jgi:hypothetical protein
MSFVPFQVAERQAVIVPPFFAARSGWRTGDELAEYREVP